MNSEREKLIKELETFIQDLSEKQKKAIIDSVDRKGLMDTDWDDIGFSIGPEDFADFILSDRQRLLAPLVEHIKTTRFTCMSNAENAIDATLRLAGLKEGKC
jgi:hypothetical protein